MADFVEKAIFTLGMDSTQLESSGERVVVVTSKIGTEFERLEAKLDKNIAVEMRRKNAIEQVNRTAQEEGIENTRRAAQIERVNAQYDQQIAKLAQLRGAAANQNGLNVQFTGSTRAMGSAIQNAAFQFGDFAVQLASGQGVIRPLIQQGSQLLQVFGPWGAVLGAAGAALGAVVVSMGLFTESAEEKKAATDKATEAAKALVEQEKLLKEALGATDEQIVKNIGSLSRYAAVGQDQVNAMLATQGVLLRDMTADRDKEQKNLDVLLSRSFQSPSRIKMEQEMAANIAAQQRKIDSQTMVVQGLAAQAVRLGRIVPTFGMVTTGTTDKPDSSINREAEQRERARQSIEDQIDALSREEKQIRMTAKERAVDVELQKAEMTARNGNIELTDVQIEALTIEAEKKFESAEASKAIAEAEKERERATKEAAKEAQRAAKEYERQLEQAANLIGDQVSMLTQAALGFENWRDVAKQAINVVINELSKLESLGGSGGGIFDLLFKIGSAALGGAAGGIGSGSVVGGPGFGTPRAEGGPVEAGRIYTVGERGPETFIPRTSGRIAANVNSAPTIIHITNDFRGAFVDQNKIDAAIARSAPKQAAASAAFISDKRQRGALPAFRN